MNIEYIIDNKNLTAEVFLDSPFYGIQLFMFKWEAII